MVNDRKIFLDRLLLSVGCSLVIICLFSIFVIFLIGSIIHMLFVAVTALYIRRKRSNRFAFSNKTKRRERQIMATEDRKLKYICLLCASEVFDRSCKSCGSHMKKPVF